MSKGKELDMSIKNIRFIRRAKGISCSELSKMAGLRQTHRISDIEDGSGRINIDELNAVCKVLQVSIHDIIEKEAVITFK